MNSPLTKTVPQKPMQRVAGSRLFSHLPFPSLFHRSLHSSTRLASDLASTVVVVESPPKAKKLQSYLGADYSVIASFGHVCDLPVKQAVDPANDFSTVWELNFKGQKQLREIARTLKTASRLVLATDPDREGEAISWHVVQQLRQLTNLQDIVIQRITFTEISKSAILQSIQSPREIDMNLVEAYLARRVIDYLLGFTLSPVLWRKLPGARSAGRVQSACLRLICERENEILSFKPQEYWSVESELCTSSKATFTAELTHLHGKSVDKMKLTDEDMAQEAVQEIKESQLRVEDVNKKEIKKRAFAPYRTSTLQQDAARKLSWPGKKTMSVAQELYDGRNNNSGGLITYMRTDGVHISGQAIGSIRDTIEERFGNHFLPEKPNFYSKKVANAQEAHEAIRPTNVKILPEQLPASLTSDEKKLYQLIWKRTVASQMTEARYLRHTITIQNPQKSVQLRASETDLLFDGFMAIYAPSFSEDEEENIGQNEGGKSRSRKLEKLVKGEELSQVDVEKFQHFTKPPSRYNEASIVKTLEDLGIGRPSTFALITSLLVTRKYVSKAQKAYIPWPLGQVLTVYLEKYFHHFVDYDFTSSMEERLDGIAEGKEKWKFVVKEFWNFLTSSVKDAYEVQVRDVIDVVNEKMLERIFFPLTIHGESLEEVRKCPSCVDGKLLIKFSKYGPFLGCSNYDNHKCSYTININNIGKDTREEIFQDLGEDEELGGHIYVKSEFGRCYIELETPDPKLKRRVNVPTKKYDVNSLTLEKAKKILTPLTDFGVHPTNGFRMTLENGKGKSKYLKCGEQTVDLPKEMERNWKKLDEEAVRQILDHKSKKASPSRPSNGVKKPRSAYILFIKEKRSSLKEEKPSYTNTQLVRELAALWKQCTPEEKVKFQLQAEEDKVRYQEELKVGDKVNSMI